MEPYGMERKPVILDYFSRALRKQPAGPHTDTSSQWKPEWVRQPHAAKSPPFPCGQPQHFPAQGKHLTGVLSDAGATELRCTSATRHTAMCLGCFCWSLPPIILSCASLIYLPSCVSLELSAGSHPVPALLWRMGTGVSRSPPWCLIGKQRFCNDPPSCDMPWSSASSPLCRELQLSSGAAWTPLHYHTVISWPGLTKFGPHNSTHRYSPWAWGFYLHQSKEGGGQAKEL